MYRLAAVLLMLIPLSVYSQINSCTTSGGAAYFQKEPCPVLPVIYQPTNEELTILAQLTELLKFRKFEEAKALTLSHLGMLEFPNSEGYTLLELAIDANRQDIIEFLISNGVNLNRPTKKGVTPLHRIALYDKFELVRLLVSHGANLEARDELMRTPLYFAAEAEKLNTVKAMVENGANVDSLKDINAEMMARNGRYQTPLYTAIANNKQKDVARYLIKHGANTKIVDYWSNTALTLASHRSGWGDIVEILLDNGADCTAVRNGKSEISYVTDPEALRLMKNCVAEIDREKAVETSLNMFAFPVQSSWKAKILIVTLTIIPFLLTVILGSRGMSVVISILVGLVTAIAAFMFFLTSVNQDAEFIANLQALGFLNHFILTLIALTAGLISILLGRRMARKVAQTRLPRQQI